MRLEVVFFDPICPVCKERAKDIVRNQEFLNVWVRSIEQPALDKFWLFIDDGMGDLVRDDLEKELGDILDSNDFEFYR